MSVVPPRYPPLTAEDMQRLEDARAWVKGHFTTDEDEKYAPVSGKLRVVGAILDQGWVATDERTKLEYLGVAFGDAVAQELLLDWVLVEDEDGRTPALNWPGTSVLCYPLSMIAKRIEDGAAFDVEGLFDDLCAGLRDMAFGGDFT